MSVSNVSEVALRGLSPDLRLAQEALNFPEVQDMLKRLAAYNLGICMPHMHDEVTGEFRTLPADMLQVESGLEVSFDSAAAILNDPQREFLPVGWFWREGAKTPLEMARFVCEKRGTDTQHYNHPGSGMRPN